MGSAVVAKCSCGLEVTVPTGGGIMNWATTRYFPYLCIACHEVVRVNLLGETQRCPACKSPAILPYDDPRLCDSPGSSRVEGWNLQEKIGREVWLTDGAYLCPKCSNMSLHFLKSGLLWD